MNRLVEIASAVLISLGAFALGHGAQQRLAVRMAPPEVFRHCTSVRGSNGEASEMEQCTADCGLVNGIKPRTENGFGGVTTLSVGRVTPERGLPGVEAVASCNVSTVGGVLTMQCVCSPSMGNRT